MQAPPGSRQGLVALLRAGPGRYPPRLVVHANQACNHGQSLDLQAFQALHLPTEAQEAAYFVAPAAQPFLTCKFASSFRLRSFKIYRKAVQSFVYFAFAVDSSLHFVGCRQLNFPPGIELM